MKKFCLGYVNLYNRKIWPKAFLFLLIIPKRLVVNSDNCILKRISCQGKLSNIQNIYISVCMHAKSLQLCPTLCDPMDHSPRGSLCPWDSPGKNIGVGCMSLFVIGATQVS